MLVTLDYIYTEQAKNGVVAETLNGKEVVPYVVYLKLCREFLTLEGSPDFKNWTKKQRRSYNEDLISRFVQKNNIGVREYLDENQCLRKDALLSRLKMDIVDFGVLRYALDDDEIEEIQINDFKTIWVVRKGITSLYVDEKGKPYQFLSDEDLKTTLDRMTQNPDETIQRMTKSNPLYTARTVEQGYRVSGTDSTAVTPDGHPGMDFACTNYTIRKFAPSTLTFEDLVKNGAMTSDMATFLRYCGRSNLKLGCVGPVSSGKTTLLGAIAMEIPKASRVILIQDPTEIVLYERQPETGANLRNTLHWHSSAVSAEQALDPTTGTAANMIAHTLRNTPDVIILGEARTPPDFQQMSRVLKTGHRILTSWHADDGADAMARGGSELATLGGIESEHTKGLAMGFDIIVSQKKLGDGSRRIMAIEEITGRMVDGSAETNVLYKFELSGDSDRREDGSVAKIYGKFKHESPLSSDLLQKFYQEGWNKHDLAPYITFEPGEVK